MSMRKIFCMIFIIGVVLISTGCWDYSEINDRAIVAGFAVDKGQDKKYLLTVEITNLSVEGKEVTMQPEIFDMEGDTLFEAIRNLISKTGRMLYWGHATAMLISEEVAREGVRPVLDLVYRDPEVRMDIDLLISREKTARELLVAEEGLRNIRSYALTETVTASTNTSRIFPTELWHYVSYLGFEGSSPVVPAVQFTRDDEKKRAQIYGSAVFKGDRMIGWLPQDDNLFLMWLWGLFEKGVVVIYDVLDSEDEVTLEILHSKQKVTPVVRDGQLVMQVNVNLEVAIAEVGGAVEVISEKNSARLQSEAEIFLEKWMRHFIEKIQQEYKSDILDFGLVIRRNLPDVWKRVKDDWDTVFPTVKADVNYHIHITRSAMTMRPIKVAE